MRETRKRFRFDIRATASVFALTSLAVLAQPATAEELADTVAAESASAASIVVLGTRRSGLDPLDAPAPVDVIGDEEIENTGVGDISQALRKLSPSLSLPSSPTGGFASSIPVGAALRGLSSDQVLVLINGKRRHTGANFTRQGFNGGRGSAAVDLSLIPVAAIARIEVLRDGAAAEYGSDAIAGVINVVLRSDDEGGNIGYRYSEFEKYGGAQNQVNAWKGFRLPNGGFLNIGFSFTDRKLANNTDPDPRRFYNQINVDGVLVNDPRELTNPNRNWPFGSPEVNNHFNVTANAELPLGDTLTLYGFGSWAKKDTIGLNFFEFPNSTNPVNQTALFRQRFPDGRIPTNLYYVDDFAATLGIRSGSKETGELDVSVNFGRNILDSFEGQGINPSWGADSATVFNTGKRINSQFNAGLDYVRDLEIGLPRPLTVAGGIAYRRETYELVAGDPIAYTPGPFYNLNPAAGPVIPSITLGLTDQDARKIHRDVYGAYISLEGNFTEKLEFGLAARTEDYSDFGGTTNVRASLRYAFSNAFSLRATAGTAYRAPSLVQLGFSAYSFQTDTSTGVPVDVLQRTLLPTSEAALLLGGKALTPEKSKNLSAGFVWRPVSGASITVDAYQIKIDDRIQLSENLNKAQGLLAPLVGTPYANLSSAAFFTNVLDTRTRGFEVSGLYDWNIGEHDRIRFSVGYAYNRTRITGAKDVVNAQGVVIPSIRIIGRVNRGSIEEGNPRDKLIVGATWTGEKFNLGVNARRYGKFTAFVATPSATSRDQTFSAQIVTDLDVGYRFGGPDGGLKISAGVQNLFESYPDYIYARGTSTTKYSFNAPEGAYGRLFYVGANYAF